MGQAADWLQYLFSEVGEGFVTITAMERGGRTHFYRLPISDLSSADAIVADHRDHNIYYNVGVQRTRLSGSERGSKRDVLCIAALWCDLDSPKEASVKRYPTTEHILSALSDMPLRHSALVQTGGGVHAYWKLNEPLYIPASDNSAEAELIEQSTTIPWGDLVRTKLRKYGDYQIDSVFDMARMMRLPGSMHQNGRPITIIESSPSVYDISDIRSYTEGIEVPVAEAPSVYNVSISSDIDGTLPLNKFRALTKNCHEFKLIWEGKKAYPSGSERDAALARIAATAGWTDAEIANLLFSYATENDPSRIAKVLRKDYLNRTISFVRRESIRNETLRILSGQSQDVVPEPPPVPEIPGEEPEATAERIAQAEKAAAEQEAKPLEKSDILSRLREVLGIPIARWVQMGYENPVYTLVLDGGRQVRIGGENCVLFGMRQFATRIYSETGLVMRDFKAAEWRSVCKGLARIVEVTDVPENASAGGVKAAVFSYLEKNHWYPERKRDYAYHACMAVRECGLVHIHAPSIVKYIAMQYGQRVTNNEFTSSLNNLGFVRKTVTYHTPAGRRSTRSYWAIEENQMLDLFSKEELADLKLAESPEREQEDLLDVR